MAVQVNFVTGAGKKARKVSARVDDIDIDVLGTIAEADPAAQGWHDVVMTPFANPKRMYAVLDALTDLAGIEKVEHNLTPRKLEGMLEIVPDVEDEAVVDGYPQTPGEQESGSSSTSQGSTDGPPMSSGDSPTEAS